MAMKGKINLLLDGTCGSGLSESDGGAAVAGPAAGPLV